MSAPTEQVFGRNNLGNIVATVARPGDLGEFEAGLLIQFSYDRSRKHRKFAIIDSPHLFFRLDVVGNDGKQSV